MLPRCPERSPPYRRPERAKLSQPRTTSWEKSKKEGALQGRPNRGPTCRSNQSLWSVPRLDRPVRAPDYEYGGPRALPVGWLRLPFQGLDPIPQRPLEVRLSGVMRGNQISTRRSQLFPVTFSDFFLLNPES